MASYIRHGLGAVRPYLYGDQSSLDLVAALGGEIVENAHGHMEIKAVYVYVPDVDATYAAAVGAGAVSVEAPKDQRYQERSGTLRDRFGNTWYVSTYKGT